MSQLSESPAPPPDGTNPNALVAIISSVLGTVFGSSFVFAVIALVQTSRTRQKGRALAVVSLVLSTAWVAAWVTAAVVVIPKIGVDRDEDGAITEPQRLSIYSLEIGDCVNGLIDGGTIEKLDAVPCDDRHKGELTALVELTGDDDEFPGDDELGEESNERCLDELEDDFPDAYDDESIGIYALQPSEETWEDGDRSLMCFAISDDRRTGSIVR